MRPIHLALVHDPAHMACVDVDVDVFFPTTQDGVPAAVAICDGCPLTGLGGPCFEHAVANREQYGIYGGQDEETLRAHVRAARRRAV